MHQAMYVRRRVPAALPPLLSTAVLQRLLQPDQRPQHATACTRSLLLRRLHCLDGTHRML